MTVAGVLLAAGASQRMGKRKALLRMSTGDETFLDALTDALRRGGCDPVVAVVSEPVEPIRAGCRLAGVRLVVNPDPARGQISSLRCALETLPGTDGIVCLLVDQGRVEAESVARVRDSLSRSSVAMACFQGQGGHPTGFSRQVFDSLRSAQADSGANRVVEAAERAGDLIRIEVADRGVIRNLNTPERYRDFLEGRI